MLVLSPLRQELVDILRHKGLRHFDEPAELASGELSYDFVDGKAALADGNDLDVACRAIIGTVGDAGIEFNVVGGLELGACALAVGVAYSARCRWFFVRKQPKDRGTRNWIEGASLEPSDRVLLVDDVVTTGGSIMKAYKLIAERASAANIVGAATLVDRGEQASSQFREMGVPYFPMATYEMLGIAPVGRGSVRASSPR